VKRTKHEVAYTRVGSTEEHCGICRHFEQPNRCEIVEGKIDAGGWCRLFVKEKAMKQHWDAAPRKMSGMISEEAREHFAKKRGGHKRAFNRGLIGSKEQTNPHQPPGIMKSGAIDQHNRPKYPAGTNVKKRGPFTTHKRPSNTGTPSLPMYSPGHGREGGDRGVSSYYGGPANRKDDGVSR
jgi:hypothetical protein